ncbi:MAG: GNAT family N-acetyltransferase, partial [Pseudomonadota bacterium]
MSETPTFSIRVHGAINEIDPAAWDRCAGAVDGLPPPNPFLSHAFLKVLETSDSASIRTGWMPKHLALEADDGSILAVVPAYLKSHSQGEYVFDHGWADAFERAGGNYYPKLQIAVPFTPATGPRLLVGAEDDGADTRRMAIAGGIVSLCEKIGVSSAHLTFLPKNEWALLGEHNYLMRKDQQFHWFNDGYETFDAFLDTLASRKRKQIRKERQQALAENGITIEWITGSDLTEAHWDAFFDFYLDTGSRKWGRPYLTRRFFSEIGETFADQTLLIMARRDGQYIAGALNF